eukprot:575917-Amorphochlora_amoeboformis.AAC.1
MYILHEDSALRSNNSDIIPEIFPNLDTLTNRQRYSRVERRERWRQKKARKQISKEEFVSQMLLENSDYHTRSDLIVPRIPKSKS